MTPKARSSKCWVIRQGMCFSMTAVGSQSCDDYETDATRGVVCTWIVLHAAADGHNVELLAKCAALLLDFWKEIFMVLRWGTWTYLGCITHH